MKKDEWIGIIVILGIIAVGLIGGAKNAIHPTITTTATQSSNSYTEQKSTDTSIAGQIQTAQTQVDTLKQQMDVAEEVRKENQSHSKYYGQILIQYVSRSQTVSEEYIVLHENEQSTTTIPLLGFTLASKKSGVIVNIPNASTLFFANSKNSESTVALSPGDTIYLDTGLSPNGSSFKVNICSGYLSQFQNFTPYLSTNCPAPRNENLSSIPANQVINDACFDYINSMSSCQIQTANLPANWSYECTNFIYSKINYTSCINTHKNDANFYTKEWRVYLKRSSTLWKSEREDIILYDGAGKIVAELKY